MPWKNGGGVTHELLRVGDGASGFGLRLSIAEVRADGPFSRFDGVDRVIALLTGRGMRLHRVDGTSTTLDRAGAPFAFSGDDDWRCELVDGATTDFNVMTDRTTWQCTVTLREPGLVDAPYVLALSTGRIDDTPVAAFDLRVGEAPHVTTVATLAVDARPRAR